VCCAIVNAAVPPGNDLPGRPELGRPAEPDFVTVPDTAIVADRGAPGECCNRGGAVDARRRASGAAIAEAGLR